MEYSPPALDDKPDPVPFQFDTLSSSACLPTGRTSGIPHV